MKKAFIALLLVVSSTLAAQTGLPRFATIQNGGMDNINLYNLNVEFRIPIVEITGRGFPFDPGVNYNSTIWVLNGALWAPDPNSNFGWLRQDPVGGATFSYQKVGCYANDFTHQWKYRYYNFKYTEPDGTVHNFGLNFYLAENPNQYPECSDSNPVTAGYGGGGYFINTYAGLGGPNPLNVVHPVTWAPTGAAVTTNSGLKDTNGNSVTSTVVNSSETDWSDSSGRLALKVINNTASTQYKYPDFTNGWSGTPPTVTMTLTYKAISTNFHSGCPTTTDYSGATYLPTSVSLPNGKSYTIEYEANGSSTTGRIHKITLPTGGYIQYDYTGGFNCTDGTPKIVTRTVNDGTTSSAWTYTRSQNGGVWQTVVTAPAYNGSSNETRYTFNASGLETKSEVFQGSASTGTLMQTIDTSRDPYNFPVTVRTTIGGKQKQTVYGFDAYANVNYIAEYDWGLASIIRTTVINHLSSQAYINANITNRVTRVEINGAQAASTDYLYDDTGAITSCPTGAPNHDYNGYGCTSTTPRGNVTTVKRYTTTSGTNPITTTLTYDDLGNSLTTTIDGTLQSTAVFSSATNYSQPDSITLGPSGTQLATSYTYNSYTGLVSGVTDPNNGASSYQYDNMYRKTQITRPDQKLVTIAYDDTARKATVTSPLDTGRTLTQVSWADGLGRTVRVQTPVGTTDTQYDSLGRASQVSNPYPNGGSASYWTTTTYDPLSRVVSIATPDSSTTTIAYDPNNAGTATVTDPAGKQKKNIYDGRGRLTSVYEPDVNNGNSLTVQTSYAYTGMDSLSSVTQGQQSRTFVYDGLNRLTQATTPEAGTVTYSYSGCSKDPSSVCSRTDARGVITSFTYDGLNRLYQVSYNVSGATGVPATATVTYSYGTSAASFNNGRLTGLTDSSHTDAYTYDLLGNVLSVGKTLAGQTYTTQYLYNDAGLATRITYPSGMYLSQAYDNTGQLLSITDNSGKQYASALTYNPAGQITAYSMGLSGATVNVALGYSPKRYQLSTLSYATNTKTLLSLNYGYGSAQNTDNTTNNGQITKITDNVDGGRTGTYSYDALSRLNAYSTVGSANYPAQTMSWAYDIYGNRTQQVTNGNIQNVSVSPTTNRLSYSYDASGNQTSDGTYAFTWDGENRMVSWAGSSVTNEYDANGLRVRRTGPGSDIVYVFSSSKPLAEYTPGAVATSPTREYVYLGNLLIGKKESGTYTFYESDHLSIRGILADNNPNSPTEKGNRPFGETWYPTPTDTNRWKFTSYERDTDIGDDYAMARRYEYTYGRFSSPDPILGTALNPQSWNRYTYALNMPINALDPSGLQCVWDDGSYDAENDPDTGNPGACQEYGGIWIEIGGDPGDWSNQYNADLQNAYENVDEGRWNGVSVTSPDGSINVTTYDQYARATMTVTGGIVTQYGYVPGYMQNPDYMRLMPISIAKSPDTNGLGLYLSTILARQAALNAPLNFGDDTNAIALARAMNAPGWFTGGLSAKPCLYLGFGSAAFGGASYAAGWEFGGFVGGSAFTVVAAACQP